jgi:hypothetical protein
VFYLHVSRVAAVESWREVFVFPFSIVRGVGVWTC